MATGHALGHLADHGAEVGTLGLMGQSLEGSHDIHAASEHGGKMAGEKNDRLSRATRLGSPIPVDFPF